MLLTFLCEGQQATVLQLPAEPKVTHMRFLQSVGTTIAAISLLSSHSAEAQVAESGYSLPLSLAVEAATEAIRSCEAHEYAVSVSVVDTSGVVKVQLKGDHSTVYTQDTSTTAGETPIRKVGSFRSLVVFGRQEFGRLRGA